MRIDDAHVHLRNRAAAAHHAAYRACAFNAGCNDALFETGGIKAQDLRRGAGRRDGDAQHGLGHAVGRCEDGVAHAMGSECGAKLRRGVGVNRLGSTRARSQDAQISAPIGLLLKGLDAGHVGEVWRAGVRGAVTRHRLEPTQRSAQEAQRRHQITLHAGVERHQRAEHQAVVVEVRQPAQQAARAGADLPGGGERAALVEQIRVRDDHAAWRGCGARGVLKVGHAVRSQGGLICSAVVGGQGRTVGGHPGRAGAAFVIPEALRRLEQFGGRQHQRGLRILNDGAQARRVVLEAHRIGCGHRHGNPPADHAGPERAHEFEAGWVDQQDPVAEGRVLSNVAGQCVHLRFQLRIRHRLGDLERVAQEREREVGRPLAATPGEETGQVVHRRHARNS